MITIDDRLAVKYAEDVIEARALGNEYNPDIYGRFPWDRSERRGKHTTLTKASMGEFCYAILKCGGKISSIYPMNINYNRSSVFYRVWLSMKQKKLLEETTAFRFDPPPVAHVNSADGIE